MTLAHAQRTAPEVTRAAQEIARLLGHGSAVARDHSEVGR
jgi:hypothetical protein